MTTYYVSPNGNDANNGLGPDASHASNKPWLTITKALGAAGIASGDTVYLAPGTYREIVTIAMTSAVAETKVIGDVANAQGFKDGSGNRLGGGYVIHTAYLTNDVSAPSALTLLTLGARDFLTFENILFVGGTASPSILSAVATSTDIIFRQCAFIDNAPGNGLNMMTIVIGNGVTANWLIERCVFFGYQRIMGITLTGAAAGVDYDANMTIRNCLFWGAFQEGIRIGNTGGTVSKGGGVDMLNNTMISNCILIQMSGTNSTSIPCTAYNSVFIGGNANPVLSAGGVAGSLVEDYNHICGVTPRGGSLGTGANSVTNAVRALMIHTGFASLWGFTVRPPAMPMAQSGWLGFGNQSGSPSVDMLNRPKPEGGQSIVKGIGAMERHDTGAKETTTVHSGTVGMKLTGPASQSFEVAVDAVATTISIYARYDTNHGTTNKPQMTITNGTECGVNDATVTMTAGIDTWEQLILNFTPARAGIVTMTVVSRSAAGNGIAYFDDFTKT